MPFRIDVVRRPGAVTILVAAIALVLIGPPPAQAGRLSQAPTVESAGEASTVTTGSAPLATPIRALASSGWTKSDIRQQVHRRSNQVRHRLDRSSLRRDGCLNRAAQRWAGYLARTNQFHHQDLGPVLRNCDMRLVAENLAVGYPQGYAVVRGWLNSPGHRANLVNRRVRKAGIGAAHGPRGWVVVQVLGQPA